MSDFASAARRVESAKKDMRKEIITALFEAMDRVIDNLRWRLDRNRSDATGTLARSLHPDSKLGTRGFLTVGIYGAEHWKYVEFGTGRGSKYKAASPAAPILPIYQWIVAKGITPRIDGPARTQWQLARVIARSISTGTRSNPFVRPVWRSKRRGRQYVAEQVQDAMETALRRNF